MPAGVSTYQPDRDAVAAHVAEHAAALAGRDPRTSPRAARRAPRPSAPATAAPSPLHRLELRELGPDGLHEDLVLEVGRAQVDRRGEIDQAPRLGTLRPSGFSQMTPFSAAPAFTASTIASIDLEAREVRRADRDGVHVLRHLGDARVDDRLAQAPCPRPARRIPARRRRRTPATSIPRSCLSAARWNFAMNPAPTNPYLSRIDAMLVPLREVSQRHSVSHVELTFVCPAGDFVPAPTRGRAR